jgi:hypothetical protein
MHGLINKAIQSFFCTTYGVERWLRVTEAAGFETAEFEAMLIYDEQQSRHLLDVIATELDRPLNEVLEDIGTFLVSNPQTESLRRLLRFCGVGYLDSCILSTICQTGRGWRLRICICRHSNCENMRPGISA